MNEKELRYMLAISEKGSIQKAALLLGKNPSSLGRVVRRIEAELDITLFKRIPILPYRYGNHSGALHGQQGRFRRYRCIGRGSSSGTHQLCPVIQQICNRNLTKFNNFFPSSSRNPDQFMLYCLLGLLKEMNHGRRKRLYPDTK